VDPPHQHPVAREIDFDRGIGRNRHQQRSETEHSVLSTKTWHRPMQPRRHSLSHLLVHLLLLLLASVRIASAQFPEPVDATESAPPPAYRNSKPTVETAVRAATSVPGDGFLPAGIVPLQRYAIGEPTPEEQLYLESINRARADPAAEAIRLRDTTDPDILSAYRGFSVNLSMMVSQISAIPAYPPLSFNSNLIAAARSHTWDQFTNSFQGHVGSDGSSPAERVSRTGYPWTATGENAFTSARHVLYGHAGFEVDWGSSTGGMQTPPGHRNNIHSGSFREAGIGVINGTGLTVGPQLVTQELATRSALPPLITGVVYYDFNGNGFYDIGEGIGGVTVNVSNSVWYAVSAKSGGYSVPAPGNGACVVSFTTPNLPPSNRAVTVTGGANVKLDFTPFYAPPRITGTTAPLVGRSNTYTFTPVGAADAYQWKQAMRVPAVTTEGAESGLASITASLSANYDVIQNSAKASGIYAFHLAHPQPLDQSLVLNSIFRPGSGGQLVWASRLTWASSNQVARVQASTNSGATWLNLWSLPGNSSAGQASFVRITNSLAPYAGLEVQIRFLYDHVGGSYYNQTSAGIGWYFDDVSFNQCEQLVNTVIHDVPSGTRFDFTPTASTNYSLRVHAKVGDDYVDWGPALLPSASGTAPLVIKITSMPVLAGNRANFNFSVISGAGGSFFVETASAPTGPWVPDTSATVTTLISGAQFRANCTTGTGGRCFYRVGSR